MALLLHPYEIARNELHLGVREWPDPGENPRIEFYWAITGFGKPPLGDETHWCSALAGACCVMAGVPILGASGLAKSWLHVGEPCGAEPGALCIIGRGDPGSIFGHVFFVEDFDGPASRPTLVRGLGGNQGDRVSSKSFTMERLEGFRRLLPPRRFVGP